MTTPAVVETKQAIAPVQQAASLMQIIERVAMSPDVDTGKLKDMLDMYERIEAKRAEAEFNTAMVAAQNEMKCVSADAENRQTHSKYASYAALDRALRPIYTKHGFALSFDTAEGAPEQSVRVVCHVSHAGGFSRSHHTDMPADGKGAKGGDVMTKTHAVGAAMSYGMRYLLKMIFNVAVGEDDDDGNYQIEFITDAQVGYINQLLTDTKSDVNGFLKHIQAQAVERIRTDQYDRVVKLLEQKKAKLAKEQANA